MHRAHRIAYVLLLVVSASTLAAGQEPESAPIDSTVSAAADTLGITSTDSVSAPPVASLEPPRHYSPGTAFALALVIPGGGEFYLEDWSDGVQAVATDVILFEALRRSYSTNGSIAFFIGAVHVVEGLFAAYECRIRNENGGRRIPKRSAPPPPRSTASTGWESPAVALARGSDDATRVGIRIDMPLIISKSSPN